MNRSVRIAVLVALSGAVLPVYPVDFPMLGSISGVVRGSRGVAQMGASVLLLNRHDRIILRSLTDGEGKFRFPALAPDQYSVRVTLSSFIPAARNMISVRPGVESYLNIQLANLFSSIELVYLTAPQGSMMTEEWKWTLRSANAIRPVLRLLPNGTVAASGARSSSWSPGVTRGMVSVSAGEGSALTPLGLAPDMGTAFAVATSVFGSRELTVSGNLGYGSQGGTPTAGFSTRLAGGEASVAPDVELTVRQASVRQVAGRSLLTGSGESPVLRTMSLKLADKVEITEEISIEYGALLEAVAYVDRMGQFSPFARLTYELGEAGVLEVGYSRGAPAADLLFRGPDAAQEQLGTLAMFPRLSLSSGHARMQRNETLETGFRRSRGAWLYSASAFADRVHDAAMSAASPAGFYSAADLLPDIASNASIFNAGAYETYGYMAAVDRKLSDGWSAGVAGGSSGMLAALDSRLETNHPEELRGALRPVQRAWAAVRANGVLRPTGTRVGASYMWTPPGTLGPAHAWLTQRHQPLIGMTVQVRQPVPTGGMPGRLEMNAEVRNLLAQGYVPVATPDGRQIWLVQFPRALRGGLSFIF